MAMRSAFASKARHFSRISRYEETHTAHLSGLVVLKGLPHSTCRGLHLGDGLVVLGLVGERLVGLSRFLLLLLFLCDAGPEELGRCRV